MIYLTSWTCEHGHDIVHCVWDDADPTCTKEGAVLDGERVFFSPEIYRSCAICGTREIVITHNETAFTTLEEGSLVMLKVEAEARRKVAEIMRLRAMAVRGRN